MTTKTRIVVEIKDGAIRLLQSRTGKEGPVICHFELADVPAGEEEHAAKILARMAAACAADKGEVIAVIPREEAVLRQVVLPAQSPEELQKIVPLQLGRIGPFSREDVFFGFSILDQDDDGNTRILLAAVPRKTVDHVLRLFEEAGLVCGKIVLSSYGIRNWLRMREANGRVDPRESMMVIDLDRTDTEICFIQQGRLLFSRCVPCGAADLERGEEEQFVEQIGLTLDACQRETWSQPVDRIVVIANGNQGGALKDILQRRDDVPVAAHDAFYEIPCTEQMSVGVSSQAAAGSLAALAGFLDGQADDGIDLIPGDVVRKREKAQIKRALVRLSAAAALCVFLAGARLGVGLVKRQSALDRAKEQLAQSKGLVRGAKQKMETLDFLAAKTQDRIFVADVNKELYLITPAAVSFHSLDLRPDRGVEIEGFADDQTAVNELQNELLKSALFKDVTLQYATKRKRAGEEFTAFRISCRFRRKETEDAG